MGAVEVFDPRLQQVIGRIPVGPRPKGLAVSPMGDRLYVTHFLTGEIPVIDLKRRVVTQVITTGADSNMAQTIALHPTNGRACPASVKTGVPHPAGM